MNMTITRRHTTVTITADEYTRLLAKNNSFNVWLGNRRCYRPEEVPAGLEVPTNEERSAVEVYGFVHNPPEQYFLYINEEKQTATTWMGDFLGNVIFGHDYRSSFGDRRVPITVYAVNGKRYHGTYYKSAGDYARIKLFKHQL